MAIINHVAATGKTEATSRVNDISVNRLKYPIYAPVPFLVRGLFSLDDYTITYILGRLGKP